MVKDLKHLSRIFWGCVVADEAHRCVPLPRPSPPTFPCLGAGLDVPPPLRVR